MLVWLSSRLASGRMSNEFCREMSVPPNELLVRDNFPTSTFPADMHGSRLLRIADNFLSVPSSIITPPPCLFQALAISSSTRSARPSSRHALPQYFPTKMERSPRPDDVRVRLCFLVKVRKATGRRVWGGICTGRTDEEEFVATFGVGAKACRITGAGRG